MLDRRKVGRTRGVFRLFRGCQFATILSGTGALPIAQVTRRLLPAGGIAVMRNTEALLVGLVPTRNSARLFIPSPSGSAVGAALGSLVLPKYWICQVWKAVNTGPARAL